MIRYLVCFIILFISWAQAREIPKFELMPPVNLDAPFKENCERYQNNKCSTIPEFLKTQKQLCEIQRSTNQCQDFEKEKPEDSWKYIKCDYVSLCFQNNVSVSDDVAACITGATSSTVELAKLFNGLAQGAISDANRAAANMPKQFKELIHAALIQYTTKNEMNRFCDESPDCKKNRLAGQVSINQFISFCDKSLSCKRKLAKEQPTTALLTDTELQQKNIASFLWIKAA